MNRKSLWLLSVALTVLFAACDEFDVPLTAEPTRDVETTLLGDWLGFAERNDHQTYARDRVRIRRSDKSTYIVAHGEALYRAWHSDVDDLPLITLQSIDAAEPKYQYWMFQLSEDGTILSLRPLDSNGPFTNGLIPSDVPDSATVIDIIRKNRDAKQLFGEPVRFSKPRDEARR